MKDEQRKWYKDGFDRLKVITPASAWKNISDQMKAFPASWYQINSEGLDAKPAPGSWDAISARLQPFNQSKKASRQVIYRGIAAIAIFAIIPFAFNDMNSVTSESSRAHQNLALNEDLQLEEWLATGLVANSLAINNLRLAIAASSANQNPVEQNIQVTPGFSNLPERFISPEIGSPVIAQVDPPASNANSEKGQIDQLALHVVMPVLNGVRQGEIDKLSAPEPRIASTKKWGIGPKVNFHGTTLLTPQTSAALSSSSDLHNPLGLNISFGLTGMYEINRKNALEADLMFNDKKSQRIEDYTDGDLVEKRTDIIYSSFSFSYKRNLLNPRSSAKYPKRLSLTSGLFGSYRMDMMEFLNDEEVTDFGEGYRSFDLGLNAGIDYSVRISPRFEWTAGLKYQIGLLNIFTGIDKVPASFFRTYTQSLGATTSILYRF
jgi:hypothetical protein